MVRITNWLVRHRKHKKYLEMAKWFRLWRRNVYKQVRNALVRQWENAFIGRKQKKRQFRTVWIERLSAVLRNKWSKYSEFINKMSQKNVIINRKLLSNIAIVFPSVFDVIFDQVVDNKKEK